MVSIYFIEVTAEVAGARRAPDDDKFIACAPQARADFVVRGSKEV